jgi:IS30 family transposase
VRDLSDSKQEGSFWDNAGNEYLTIRHAAKALGVNKTTVSRALQHGQFMTADGTPAMQIFAYQVRSGVRKTVQAIARSAIERHKQQVTFDEQVIRIIQEAHHITCASAKRAYKRLKQRLEKHLGYAPEYKEIQRALCDDPKVRHWGRQHMRPTGRVCRRQDAALPHDPTRDDVWEQHAVQHDFLYQEGIHIIAGHGNPKTS